MLFFIRKDDSMIDYLIVGGGIIGTFIARELSHYDVSVTLLEKEKDLAQVQTTHNSALVHSPVVITPDKGYFKSKFALEGNKMQRDLVEKFDIPALKTGAYLLAMNDEEFQKAKEMAEGAKARGVDEVCILSGDAMRKEEPNISQHVVGGLFMQSAMTVDTYTLVKRVASNATINGVTINTGEQVTSITHNDDKSFTVHTNKHTTYTTRYIINAAGVKNALVASMIEKQVPYTMIPRRGDYFAIKNPRDTPLSKITLYPIPGNVTKGVLIIPQPNETVLIGPTAKEQTSLYNNQVHKKGLEEIKKDAKRLLQNIPYQNTLHTYAGIRSSIDKKDFYIHASLEHDHFIHVAGIDSPGVTAAPAIAKYVVNTLLMQKDTLKAKHSFDPYNYKT